MTDRLPLEFKTPDKSTLLTSRIFSLIAVILLISSLFAVLSSNTGATEYQDNRFTSDSHSNSQFVGSVPPSGFVEINQSKRIPSFPNQVFYALMKSSCHLRTPVHNHPFNYPCTYTVDCHHLFLRLDLPPPSLL